MNARGIIRIQLKKVTDLWNHLFKTRNTVNDPQDAVYDEIELYLPYYVVVECGSVNKTSMNFETGSFFDNASITGRVKFINKYDKLNDEEWLQIDTLNHGVVQQHLFDIQPEVYMHNGIRCYRVPLGGVDTNNQRDINNYLHNLMFWESMLDIKNVGPLALRYVWILEKLYTQKRSIDDINNLLRKQNAYKEKYEDDPTQGVRELCERIKEISDITKRQISDIMANQDRYIRDNEEKEMMLHQIAEMNHFSAFFAMRIEESNKIYSQMTNMMERIASDRDNLKRLEEEWKEKTDKISTQLKELLDKHGRD